MIRSLAAAVLLVLLCSAAAAAPLQRGPQLLTISVQESRVLEVMGATAAWAVDPAVADAAAFNGKVTIFGRAAGRTKIVIVSITAENTIEVEVQPRFASSRPSQKQTGARNSAAVAEIRYASATREVQNSVTATNESKTGRTEVSARLVHHAGEPAGGRAQTSIAAASYRIFTRDREITILDRSIDHSPLTLAQTPVRGIHYIDDGWRMHAGYTAHTVYQSFLVPIERQFVAGAAYRFDLGARGTLTPGVFTYGGEGTTLSMLYGYEPHERLQLRSEVAYSNAIGGALQLAYEGVSNRVRADLRYRPDAFAVVRGNPRGSFGDVAWSRTSADGSSAAVSISASDVASSRVLALNGDFDARLTDRVWLLGGASWAELGKVRTTSIPAGIRFEFARGSAGAVYRYATSATNRGGHGVRLFGRASLGRLHVSASADRQQNAPTLDVIFSERPDLALALEQLGIEATSPADIARALRENSVLADLGFIEGITVDLAPMRTQLAIELGWLSASQSRQQFRARLTHSAIESVARRAETTIATLSYSRRLNAASDLFVSYSWWRVAQRGLAARIQPLVEIGVRREFDSLGALAGGTGTISGIVYVDDDLDGRSDGEGVAAVIELDGSRSLHTNADGSFAFTRVPRGSHRVVARLPDRPDAYFTTASKVEVETGAKIAFGVATTPARLLGRVTSDGGAGIASIRLLLARGRDVVEAYTDSSGAFAFATAPGEWTLTLLTDSVPAGYSLTGTEPRTLLLDRAAPLRAEYTLRAHRTLNATGAIPRSEVRVPSLGRTLRADEQGRFSLRNLPAGPLVLVANGGEHTIELPEGPAVLPLRLDAAETAIVRTSVVGERHDTMEWVVAIGAYRVRANALATAARARATGVSATIGRSGDLTTVEAGPFGSHASAVATAAQLTSAGLEAVVLSRK